ncbi:MAG TPA: hypothetical protein PLR25_12905, partial [Planctomycetaceae bacterium]|nr:hypothetical protein [Planctomycetaceae bacterium]
MNLVTILSFLFFTALVGLLTWLITRKDDHASSQGYFLAGRTLTFPLIAGSLLLNNDGLTWTRDQARERTSPDGTHRLLDCSRLFVVGFLEEA